ncbi:CCR4-NOT transcription complex subunit 4 [Pancytospora philotis]|nr:CCR4-NOT transcription complex subunit 4 [Pancytospora philotis]
MGSEVEGGAYIDFYNIRVIQKTLVYIIGIPQRFAEEATLRRHEFFGQFGAIKKIIINRRTDARPGESTASAYITYTTQFEAKWCIQEVDESLLDGRVLRCTYGTTKYCSFYLKNVPCQNNDCMYLHSCRPPKDVLTKDELVGTKHKLHEFECHNRNIERIGKKQRFEFLEELFKFKSHADYRPPKSIMFEPIDFSESV